jgi:Serine/threonine protein kinase
MSDSAGHSESTPGEKVTPTSSLSVNKYAEGSLIAERFRIVEKIGGGGMGVVFKAIDQVLKRDVAVKVLDSAYTDQDILRFQQEAKACRAFNHPNLLTVLDFGLTGGNQPYLAMEYVSGNTLTNSIKGSQLDLHKSVNILMQICDGMSKAHELNIIHRDLKPSNILLTSTADGAILVKVIDFGIAKRIDEEQKLTTAGVGIGSPLYMSPEQARGEEVDSRCDIYSFGCIGFEMLTGKPPFRGKDAIATMTMHMTHELPALNTFYDTAVVKSISAGDPHEVLSGLYAIISKCLSKNRDAATRALPMSKGRFWNSRKASRPNRQKRQSTRTSQKTIDIRSSGSASQL